MFVLRDFRKKRPNSLPPAHAGSRIPFRFALEGRRFRLACQSLAFSLWWWVSAMRVVSVSGGRPNGMVVAEYVGDMRPCLRNSDNRISGCMSIARCECESNHRLMVRVRGPRRGGVFRARESDGSPRNGWMVRIRPYCLIPKNRIFAARNYEREKNFHTWREGEQSEEYRPGYSAQ